jgi:hypothetical protein
VLAWSAYIFVQQNALCALEYNILMEVIDSTNDDPLRDCSVCLGACRDGRRIIQHSQLSSILPPVVALNQIVSNRQKPTAHGLKRPF